MATPLSEGVSVVLGAAAAGGTSREDEHHHVQPARAYIHDIMGTIIGGSTKASLMHMVGEGYSPKCWRLRATSLFMSTVATPRVSARGSCGPAGVGGGSPDVPEGPAAASGLAAALLGAWERLDWAWQFTMIAGTAAASFGWRSELLGAAYGRDLCSSMRTHNCSARARAAAWAGARRCAQMRVPSRQSPVI